VQIASQKTLISVARNIKYAVSKNQGIKKRKVQRELCVFKSKKAFILRGPFFSEKKLVKINWILFSAKNQCLIYVYYSYSPQNQ
jgi:hypothetical protein